MTHSKIAIIGGRPSSGIGVMVAAVALGAACGEVIVLQQEESTESLIRKYREEEGRQRTELEGVAVEFQKLAAVCGSKDEWWCPPIKKFRGKRGYLNGQNLPFYMRF